LGPLGQVEARFEVRQQLLGDGLAGVGHTDFAAHLEIRHTDPVAALLQRQRALIDFLPDLQGVPGFRSILQGGQRVFEVVRIAAQLGGLAAKLVIAIEVRPNIIELLPQLAVVARSQGLLERQGGGTEVLFSFTMRSAMSPSPNSLRAACASWAASEAFPWSSASSIVSAVLRAAVSCSMRPLSLSISPRMKSVSR
jgi:hypothetical protein